MTGEWFLIVYMTIAGATSNHVEKFDSELSCFLNGRVQEMQVTKQLKRTGDNVMWTCGHIPTHKTLAGDIIR